MYTSLDMETNEDRERRPFEGKRVVLTGAASGIGRALALDLASRGAHLALNDIDARGLEAVAREVRLRGHAPSVHVADLADGPAVERLAHDARDVLGHVDILVNNAGVAVVSPLVGTTDDDLRWVMDVNVWGPIRLTRALLPGMIARGSGRIVMTASLAGLVGAPGMVAYSTTKFAVVGFAEALRHEVEGHGIGVTVVCPGYVRTGFHAATRYRNGAFARFLSNAPRWYGVSAERAAELVLAAVARGRSLVTIGPEKTGWFLKRLSPELGFEVTRWVAKQAGILHAGTEP
jgi:short-subunit dehydrogenase